MHIKQILARGAVLIVAAVMAVVALDAAYAVTKKGKHAKPPQPAHTTGAPTPASTAVAPPDPGVYK
jgi:hypothetical protein